MDSTPNSTTAQDYMLENRGRIMVLQKAEGQPLRSEDFFVVESVGSHPTGLIVTGLFEHNRREPLRLSRFRPATEVEIASQGK